MTNNPKQPRGPGGKFAKAEKPVVFIDDDIIRVKPAITPTFSNEGFMAGIERELEKPRDAFFDQVERNLNRAHRMKWIGITLAALAIPLLGMLIVAAIAWIR